MPPQPDSLNPGRGWGRAKALNCLGRHKEDINCARHANRHSRQEIAKIRPKLTASGLESVPSLKKSHPKTAPKIVAMKGAVEGKQKKTCQKANKHKKKRLQQIAQRLLRDERQWSAAPWRGLRLFVSAWVSVGLPSSLGISSLFCRATQCM